MIKKEYTKTLKQLEQMKTPKALEIREYRQKIQNLEHNIEQVTPNFSGKLSDFMILTASEQIQRDIGLQPEAPG